MRSRVAFALLLGAVLSACVGSSDPVPSSTTEPDAGTSTNPALDGSTPAADSGGVTPGTDAGASACATYCTQFATACSFSTQSTISYPSNDACLAICATIVATGATADSIECREGYLAKSSCALGGPWGIDTDQENSPLCGDGQPCAAICRTLSPKCTAAGSDLGDCTGMCGTNGLTGGSTARDCMEQAALGAYTAAGPADVVKECDAFRQCGTH